MTVLAMMMASQPQRARLFEFFHFSLLLHFDLLVARIFSSKILEIFSLEGSVLNAPSEPNISSQFKTDFSFAARATHLLALPCFLLNPSAFCLLCLEAWMRPPRSWGEAESWGREEQAVLIF